MDPVRNAVKSYNNPVNTNKARVGGWGGFTLGKKTVIVLSGKGEEQTLKTKDLGLFARIKAKILGKTNETKITKLLEDNNFTYNPNDKSIASFTFTESPIHQPSEHNFNTNDYAVDDQQSPTPKKSPPHSEIPKNAIPSVAGLPPTINWKSLPPLEIPKNEIPSVVDLPPAIDLLTLPPMQKDN